MKRKIIALTALILTLAIALIACAVSAESDGVDVELSNADEETLADVSEQQVEEPEPELETDEVQRVMTEEMKKAVYYMIPHGTRPYDPGDEVCKSMMSFYESGYYANHVVNGYTLCSFRGEWVSPCIVEYEKDGYCFTSGNFKDPSPLGLYLYKDGEFTTIEEAFKQGLVTPAEIHAIVAADIMYDVGVETYPD